MTCQGSDKIQNEHEFVATVTRTGRALFTCCGPLIIQGLSAVQLALIEGSFHSQTAHDLLWAGFEPHLPDAMFFRLCALHWMELACLVSLRGHQFGDPALRSEGARLLSQVCATEGWDVKEIANAFQWQQVRLT